MSELAILEASKTPYRPHLFEKIGQTRDLTVLYVGEPPGHRRWDTDHRPENYTERFLSTTSVGPFQIVRGLYDELVAGEFDEIVGSPDLPMLPNSFVAQAASERLGAIFSVWTEHVRSEWILARRDTDHRHLKRALQVPVIGLRKLLYARTDRIVAYSELAGESAREIGVDPGKIVTYPQSIHPELVQCPSDSTGDGDCFRVLYLGSLVPRKGVDVLLDAAHRLGPRFELVIAGKGELRTEVERVARRRSTVEFLGYLSEAEKYQEYARADLFVLPSKHEPWGLVVNEAQMSGTPVVTTEAAGAKMIVPDERVVAPEDPDQLLDAIRRAESDPNLSANQAPTISEMAAPFVAE